MSVIEGQAGPAMAVEIKLRPAPESARRAREFVRTHFIEWGFPKGADDAALIADELACNAIAAAPETPFLVSLRMVDGAPMLEVADCSPARPVPQPPDFMAEHGRGLHIVAALSVAWDSYPVPGGKVVWAALRTE
ncbi:MAG TPA: ATP-binding protein [Streptosporangiaceae bacterium]